VWGPSSANQGTPSWIRMADGRPAAVCCRDLAVVSRNRCVALGRPRWESSGAGAHRPVTAFGRSRRCYCWVGPLLACSRCVGRALRSAPPPDGRRRRIPTPPAVTRSGRGARLDSGYESGRRCGDPASSAAPRRTCRFARGAGVPKQTPLASPPDDLRASRGVPGVCRGARSPAKAGSLNVRPTHTPVLESGWPRW
jgi:hypothetical protein